MIDPVTILLVLALVALFITVVGMSIRLALFGGPA